MGVIKDQVSCNLRSARRTKGLSQSELAERVGVKRQAIYDMETGRYVPNTALALRMAKELGCRVEDLFALDESEGEKPVTLVEKMDNVTGRVSVAKVRERLIAYPLDGRWLLSDGFQAADGLLSSDCSQVQLLQRTGHLERKIVLLGCDPAFAILAGHASRWSADATVHCRFASSHLAMERLATGYAHIAGTHLHNPTTMESNVALAKKILTGTNAMVVAFSFFEEGLMVAPGNPCQIRTVADLAREEIRFVNREPGAALRILLDEHLARAGLTGECIRGYQKLVASHNQCAQMVAFNMADAALGLRAVAAAHGLDFVTMEAVRCDMVIPYDFLDLPAIKVLLDVLQTRSLREELSALPGYESTCTGKVVDQV
ncbi:MAG TPA: XRE family transcriptional regulator [Syntrophobacteraceae bacterium]|nr:XRE family transcriptional regulator [Syntrophobacteraceae bacterium]